MFKSINFGISSPLPVLGKGGVSLLLALCFSAGLSAQTTSDPFPAVNYHLYPDNMTFLGQVRLNGEVQPNGTIIAVYCGDEIRGKGEVKKLNSKHNQCAKFNITGEKKGEPLHFKVCTNGRVIEVDQSATFLANNKFGSTSEYYYIDLPVPVETKSSIEGWSTICLPYNAEIPDGVTVYTAIGVGEGELKVAKYGGKVLPANTPVLVESAGDISFEWLARITADKKPDVNIFKGTTEKTDVVAGTVYTLGHESSSGEIGFWRFTETEIPANRAYISIPSTEVKGFRIELDDDIDGLEVPFVSSPKGKPQTGWYDLNGRKLKGKPTHPGVYINNGNKQIVNG